jgi:hypothetical protein
MKQRWIFDVWSLAGCMSHSNMLTTYSWGTSLFKQAIGWEPEGAHIDGISTKYNLKSVKSNQ